MKFQIVVIVLTLAGAAHADPAPFQFADGDRVAFIGDTFVEREQVSGYIETALTTRLPDRAITFRNLGYSGDTVTGSARGLCAGWATFEDSDKAFDRLRKLVAEYKPTVLLVNYGMTESFIGPEGIPTFTTNYGKMIDALSVAAGGSPRVILLSPNAHEDLGRPLPDPSAHNKNLRAYADAVAALAAEHKYEFIDLFALTADAARAAPITSNGIHLTPYGYWRTAIAIESALGYPPREWSVALTAAGQISAASGTRATDAHSGADGLSFTATDALLPEAPAPKDAPATVLNGSALPPGAARTLKVSGLAPGVYELKADDVASVKAESAEWAKGVNIGAGPGGRQVETLRKLVVAKNFDYFNYQRPDNDAYILAFRKGEQGRNAVEIPQFLPLAAEKDKQIAAQRAPRPVHYVFEPVK